MDISLQHSSNMRPYNWSYTQFSQFNSDDSLLLVSGVFVGPHNSSSGEIAVISMGECCPGWHWGLWQMWSGECWAPFSFSVWCLGLCLSSLPLPLQGAPICSSIRETFQVTLTLLRSPHQHPKAVWPIYCHLVSVLSASLGKAGALHATCSLETTVLTREVLSPL